jgi:RNA polymerase sigma-70 factor (ECF subfamily)
MEKDELFALVEKAIAGDEVAFAALYTQQIKSIIFLVRNWLYDSNSVDDATSEVVLNMYKSISGLTSPYAFKPWLQKIIINVCIGLNRKNNKTSSVDISDYESTLVDDDIDIDPEGLVMSGDEGSDINVAIDALPPIQRRTLILYFYEELSYQEIADVLEVSINTVSTNLMKAKNNLKGILELKGYTYQNLMEEDRKGGFGIAVSSALGLKVSNSISSAQVDSALHACGLKLQAAQAAAGTANGTASSAVKVTAKAAAKVGAKFAVGKIVTVVVASAAVLGGGMFLAHTINTADNSIDTELAPYIATEDSASVIYEPDVSIEFSGDDDSLEHVNPTSAVIKGYADTDTIDSWTIYNVGTSSVAASGDGSEINSEVFAGLQAGNYKITWQLISNSGEGAKASRAFEIQIKTN